MKQIRSKKQWRPCGTNKSLWPFLLGLVLLASCAKKEKQVLVFSKTEGFRHSSIETGVAALKKLGTENGFAVTATEDAAYFVEDSLKRYDAIVFLNTTGNVLNDVQQADMERYIQAGGGFVGIHAATDTEYDWPWYTKLVGAQFESHPHIQEAKVDIVDHEHPATAFLDSTWTRTDEWYNFKNRNPEVNVLAKIDESSYEGGKNGKDHPMVWYHDYDGGRAFYTEFGHTEESYADPLYLKHVLGGIQYAMDHAGLDYTKAKSDRVPPEDRFAKEVLDFNLDEPMELDELPGQGILFVERKGKLRLYDWGKKEIRTLAEVPVFNGNEDGLLGLAVDPNYVDNHWIYLFYSAPTGPSRQHISRFTLENDTLDFGSEKILLTVPTSRNCCHSGGGLEFGPDGNLFIGIGDNTNPFKSNGFAPIDERRGREAFDAQRSAGNTNDLRGKILRITPQPDGTYTIPKGNLFPEGTANARPEIYVMGCRNPFRFHVDSKTGYVYWGDVGPDAGKADPERGPSGMGEYDQARHAGYWGWPYTRGYNEAYNDYDFATETSGAKFDPEHLVNDSPNNTGLRELPPAQKSMIPMTYYRSEEFPWMGEGGINPMAGPVFHKSDMPNAKTTFPDYFENKLFLYEWIRDWIYVVTLDDDQNFVKAEAFMPSADFSHPMDIIFGSDGNMYMLEYGQKWFAKNLDARLSRIRYLPGNREPIAKIQTDKTVGAVPLTVAFSAAESLDYDHDALSYEWTFAGGDKSAEKETSYTFDKPGVYNISLKVTDTEGQTGRATTRVLVGNDAPVVSIQLIEGDTLYREGEKITYKVVVTDKQDGSSVDGSISPDDIKVTFDYIPEGKDMAQATIGHQQNVIPEGKKLIEGADCKACHALDIKVNGPSYQSVAEKYTEEDKGYLVSKIIKGGSGVWGETVMSAHPQLSVDEVTQIVDYILSLKPGGAAAKKSLPLEGSVTFDPPKKEDDDEEEGTYLLMASYKDKGNAALPDAELMGSAQIIFTPEEKKAD